MSPAPIVVHPPRGEGGRRVTADGVILGMAYSDGDLVELLRLAGVEDAEDLVAADTALIEWRGLVAHDYGWGPGERGYRPPPAR
ncbi:hypothetical protein OG897_13425 [Streptomyces sp. NBC_00237]|uniref:hypothetical protein n=1 Tax=Streptomyces sp. NBC_00237 TaxID=2975687 RepID=UPI0022582020|nr:hypothetical protein [Streptomyces sp. NBC_00237]MCX5202444.1 hypothetical protein [Streptomyces sp. NBC_00237]